MSTRTHAMAPVVAALLLASNAAAQDHSHHQAATPPATPPAQDGQAPDEHADHADHAAHTQAPPPSQATPEAASSDHSTMQHGAHDAKTPPEIDHAAMGHASPPAQADPAGQAMDHGAHAASPVPTTPVPAPTDAERAAAVRPTGGHAMHDDARQSFVLLDRLEAFDTDAGHGVEWEVQAWAGTDRHKLWLRSEGEEVDGHTEDADLELLYGRSVAPWWDVVGGVRHHFEPGGSQDMLVLGVMGLAPYKFEVDASLYLGESGYTGARVEVEYEALLTNRLILQPALEVNLHGKDDAAHGNGQGLGTVELGLRLRYEITRRFAPYLGLVRERAYGGTADLRREEGEDIDDTRIVAGVRVWF